MAKTQKLKTFDITRYLESEEINKQPASYYQPQFLTVEL